MFTLSLAGVAASGLDYGMYEALMGLAAIVCAGLLWNAIHNAFLN